MEESALLDEAPCTCECAVCGLSLDSEPCGRQPCDPPASPAGRPRPGTWRKLTRRFVWLALAVAALVSLGRAALRVEPPPGAPGTPAPVFSLPLIGREGQLGTPELRGRPVVVTFWASGCDRCPAEAGLLEEVWRRHRGAGLVVLGVNVGDTDAGAAAFLARHGVTYPAVADSGVVAASFGVTGLPETYFVDRGWRIAGLNRGFEFRVDRRLGMAQRQEIFPVVLERAVEGILQPPMRPRASLRRLGSR